MLCPSESVYCNNTTGPSQVRLVSQRQYQGLINVVVLCAARFYYPDNPVNDGPGD